MAQAKKDEQAPQDLEVTNYDVVNMDNLSFSESMAKYNTNDIKLAGTVTELRKSDPQAKIDKKTNAPVLDANGQQEYWEPFYSVGIIFEGAELNVNVDKTLFDKMELTKRYMFLGRMGTQFKKTQPIFYSATLFA